MLLSRLAPGCRRAPLPAVLLWLTLVATLAACMAYQPPSGRGYDYDRGRALARSDVRAERFAYLVTGNDAGGLADLSQRSEARCGFSIRAVSARVPPEPHDIEFAQGYNSVSVPAIEQRLGAPMRELMRRCTGEGGAAD